MKTLLATLIRFCCISAGATTYYVKTSGGTGTGRDDGTAWSLAKLNTVDLVVGDSVLFKRGDVLYGTILSENKLI